MLQYLLNTTAIWLISLLSYELFLKKESYHSYNRFYLLFTFLLGALLPILQWQDYSILRYTAVEQPLVRIASVKQTIVEAGTSHSGSFNWMLWVSICYYAGVVVAILILLRDAGKLAAFMRSGTVVTEGSWKIIETHKEHAPFSFRNTLFVSSRGLYSADEWQMIVAHESRHTTLLHFADLMLMQAAKVVFWFHPLVYAYTNRLLLVHEYQADNASAQQPQVYGRFLVEQAMLQAAPSLSHSFNRSPIKNRIIMLTRRSSALAKGKMLVFVPVALVCFFCFSKNGFGQKFERNGNHVTYKGNIIELSTPVAPDTQIIVDPVTGQEYTNIVIKRKPAPVKLNGKPVNEWPEQDAAYTGSESSLRDFLVFNMKDVLTKLDDGQYTLNVFNVLIDENGHIAFFEYEDIKRSRTADEIPGFDKKKTEAVRVTNANDPQIKVSIGGEPMMLHKNTDPDHYESVKKELRDEIFNKVCRLMETAPGFKPARANGTNVISYYFDIRFLNHFKIKDHKLYEMDKNMEFKEVK